MTHLRNFSVVFRTIFLSCGIATSIDMHVLLIVIYTAISAQLCRTRIPVNIDMFHMTACSPIVTLDSGIFSIILY